MIVLGLGAVRSSNAASRSDTVGMTGMDGGSLVMVFTFRHIEPLLSGVQSSTSLRQSSHEWDHLSGR